MRQRTQKSLATRIDRMYYRRLHGLRRWRRGLVFVAIAAAILYVGLATYGGKGELIHDPGRLAPSHASFENNRAGCHDGCDTNGKPTGKFSKAVSDFACLPCHAGAIHHPTQGTQVVFDPHRDPPGSRSANCASCHKEHRGVEALTLSNDLQCLQCHSDLTGKTLKPPSSEVPMHVTGFSLEDHPHFGRSLMQDGKLVDPTVLTFSHKIHLQGALKGSQMQCTSCHSPD